MFANGRPIVIHLFTVRKCPKKSCYQFGVFMQVQNKAGILYGLPKELSELTRCSNKNTNFGTYFL
jgi:hypothetical protein